MGKDLKGKELGKHLSQRKDGTYEAKFTDNFGRRHSIYDKKLPVEPKPFSVGAHEITFALNSDI